MAEIWGIATATVIGAGISAYGNSQAANAHSNAAKNSLQLQQQEHDQTVQNLAPYNAAGTGALNALNAANNGDYSGFYNSPGYQFAQQQGIKALDASAASKGNLYSGGYGENLANYASGLASQQYNTWYGQQMGLASLGQNAAAGVGNANSSYANAATGINTNAGNNAASNALGNASIWNNALNQFGSAYGQYASQPGAPSSGTAYSSTNLGLNDPSYLNTPSYLNSGNYNTGQFNQSLYGGLGG